MKRLIFLGLMLISMDVFGQVKINANLNVKHKIGTVDTFDRRKFITIHASLTENDWDGDNELPNFMDSFLNGNNVYLGRNTGGIQYQMNAQVTEDPARPGFANPASVASLGQTARNNYKNTRTARFPYEYRSDMILCAQAHPFYPDGKKTLLNWAFSQTNTEQEPFGTASGEFMGRYIKENFGTGGTTGEKRPAYCEVINEPEWDLVDFTPTPIPFEQICTFHLNAAKEIHKLVPDMPVGGYCTAFPDHEKNNFEGWTGRWKLFMDIAGAEMDYWTIHLYDFPSISNGKKRYRKGGNMEATFDMMEQYSMMKFGKVKPFMVSEFGASVHDYDSKAWSPYRDWLRIASVNAMWMQFMERPNIINKVVPFVMNKAEWAYTGTLQSAHNSRLMRKKNEPTSYTGQWVYTEQVKMYQLWADVSGTRVDVISDNLDIMVDAYVNKNKAYLIVNNLDFVPRTLQLNTMGANQTPTNVKIKHLYLQGGKDGIPVLDVSNVNALSSSLEIGAEATYVIEMTYPQNIIIDKTSEEKKYYSDTYFKPITANSPIVFNINNVEKGSFGEATLRIGVGRAFGKSLTPTVKVNGTLVTVPTNYRGDNQQDKASFFGMLEIPVPYSLLSPSNRVEITFPDTDGYVSSVTMRAFNFSANIRTSIDVLSNAADLKVYPNPNLGIIELPKESNWQLFSEQGIELLKGKGKQVNMLNINAGVYLLQIDGKVVKVIKQ